MSFLHPLWLPIAVALLFAFLLLHHRQELDNWAEVMHPGLLQWFYKGQQNGLKKQQRIPAYLLACLVTAALASPVLTLALPSFLLDFAGGQDKNRENTNDQVTTTDAFAHASGWLLLMDVSKSTTLTDVAPSRFSAMRAAALQISQQAGAIPVGLIVYSGDAFMISPPAIDKQFLEEKIALLDAGLVETGGSNPTRAIALANSVLETSGFIEARIFVLTDGGGLNTKTRPAVTALAKQGHRLDLIAFGHEIPAGEVLSPPEQLRKLAQLAGGSFQQSDALGRISLARLDLSKRLDATNLTDHGSFSILGARSHSNWLLLLALPLCLLLFCREQDR